MPDVPWCCNQPKVGVVSCKGVRDDNQAQVLLIWRPMSRCSAMDEANSRSTVEEPLDRRRRCLRICCSASIRRSWIHWRYWESLRTDSVLRSSVSVALISLLISKSLWASPGSAMLCRFRLLDCCTGIGFEVYSGSGDHDGDEKDV